MDPSDGGGWIENPSPLVDPENNLVMLDNGDSVGYSWLVVAAGIQCVPSAPSTASPLSGSRSTTTAPRPGSGLSSKVTPGHRTTPGTALDTRTRYRQCAYPRGSR